ncbi:MAG: hypothetical protein IPG76_04275 [Acidobacteria bacterium]|nr:hypothetical protein [Acidobacteriota bacterium]
MRRIVPIFDFGYLAIRSAAAHLKKRSGKRSNLCGKDLVALASVQRGIPDQVVTAAQMASIKVPAISIVGTADPLLKRIEELKKVMPQLKIVTIEGATHSGDRGAVRRPGFVHTYRTF